MRETPRAGSKPCPIKIGRAAGREKGEISGGAGLFKKKKKESRSGGGVGESETDTMGGGCSRKGRWRKKRLAAPCAEVRTGGRCECVRVSECSAAASR